MRQLPCPRWLDRPPHRSRYWSSELPVCVPLNHDQEIYTYQISSAFPMLFYQYHVYHSLVASRNTHREMLEFSARNDVKPLIQVVKHNGLETVKKVFEDLNANKIRYRAVLEF